MKKETSKQIIKGIIIFILFYLSSYIQLIPIYLFKLDISKLDGTSKVALSTFSNIVLLIILILIYRKELYKEWKIFKDNLYANIDLGFKYWSIGLIVMFISNIFINIVLKNGQAANEQAVQEMITYAPLLMVLNAGIIAPIIEELTFRKAFKNMFNKKWVFILTSGIIFGALHVVTSITSIIDLLYIIPYSSLGIAFAYMYYKTDTVYTPISMHMIHNTILTIISII